jgi:internalin A
MAKKLGKKAKKKLGKKLKVNDRMRWNELATKHSIGNARPEYNDNGKLVGLDFSLTTEIDPSSAYLQALDVEAEQPTVVPPGIGQFTSLLVLDLSNTQLAQLPPQIGQLINLRELRLDGSQLTQVPPQIGQLTNLQILDLNNNQLTRLPPEIVRLINLRELTLRDNPLAQLPPEIGQLTNLQTLSIYGNQLTQLPPQIGQLTNLQALDLGGNPLAQLPPEIWQLTNLGDLGLEGNQLSQVPPEIRHLTNLWDLDLNNNELTQLPPEIEQLVNLQTLRLYGNQLTQLPRKIGQLTNLRNLYLTGNQLTQLPPEMGQLTNLQILNLTGNQLTQLPRKIGQLTNLQALRLTGNQLTQLPPEIGQLTNLQILDLNNNQLTQLPPEIGQLTNLQTLNLEGNQLTQLPPEMGQLTNLQTLRLTGNPLAQLPPEMGQLTNMRLLYLNGDPTLLSPPSEIVTRGTPYIMEFLKELKRDSVTRHEAKLLVVGEGGTGKSSLLRALHDEDFDAHFVTTHGIELGKLSLEHPTSAGTEITLHTWDFGGQEIYHATHQFFLTRRSLYLVIWNSRHGQEQGKLNYWLDTIKSLAPDAPILLVATHTDERLPDLNYQSYKEAYPQLVGSLDVSNKTGSGIERLRDELRIQASWLPLMGQPWPRKWVEAEQAIERRPEHHVDAETYTESCDSCGVDADVACGTLGNYLHDLGKILYFSDEPELSNMIVLKPNWITKAISRVLENETVRAAHGILSHSQLPQIWSTDEMGQRYDPHLYPVFLRLMEKFDLSYQVEADIPGTSSTHSLIPQLLPHQPPADLPPWPENPPEGHRQVEMVYRLNFVPAGIMSWFIVRTHRYTKDLHWREGVVLEYEGHQARVELNPMLRTERLVVHGPAPYNFFTILKSTIDLILARFEGLEIGRDVPCICHRERRTDKPCGRYHLYEDLVRRMEAGKQTVECPETFMEVSVPEMLYGIHMSTNEQVILDIRDGQRQIKAKLGGLDEISALRALMEQVNQRSELIGRDFTRLWNLEMKKLEAQCPNTFFLVPGDISAWNPKNWVSQEYWMYLICQHPPGPHPVGNGYPVRQADEWWATVSPWLNHLVRFLKFAIPMGSALGTVYDEASMKEIKNNIKLMEEITKNLPTFKAESASSVMASQDPVGPDQVATGPALRALYSFLTEVDKPRNWGGLTDTVTPDGNILWLCAEHRKQYEPKVPNLGVSPSGASSGVC